MRKIKFRTWYLKEKIMLNFEQINLEDGKFTVWDRHGNTKHKCNTLMLYTGLKDKNGIEIYEGDVLKRQCFYPDGKKNGNSYMIVKWNNNQCGFGGIVGINHEVIGNIYENPDFLTSPC